MFKKHPLLSRFLLFIGFPIIVASIVVYQRLVGSLPAENGEYLIAGLKAPVTIKRDGHGVVYIRGDADQDVFTALGYAHAQDRFWQLTVQKYMAQGRLSELFGKTSVTSDLLFRTLGLHRSAQSAWETLSPAAQHSLTAYTNGINAWLAQQSSLPVEFQLLGLKPERWTEIDSLAWMKVFALDLASNYRKEIDRMVASGVLTNEQLATFFPNYPADGPVTVESIAAQDIPSADQLGMLLKTMETEFKLGGRFVGSNAWAVSGTLNRNGKALLANDPHLSLQLPSYWYAADLRGKGLQASGMSLVGLPLIIFGKNNHIAWAGTSLMADVQDLYLEKQNSGNSNQYAYDGQWFDYKTRIETIKVREDFPQFLRQPLKPLQIAVRETLHGPVLSDIVSLSGAHIALKWTALQAKDSSYDAFLALNYAKDWNEFQSAMEQHVAPALNMLFADNQGNIGYLAAGRIPVRRGGLGLFPVAGDTSQHEWQGYIPSKELPRAFNPPSGLIVSANNKVIAEDYPYFISNDWAPPTRANRITQLLNSALKEKQFLTAKDMTLIQADTVNEPVKVLRTQLLTHKPNNEQETKALALIAEWDGNMDQDSAAATIFMAWTSKLRIALFSDELQGYWNRQGESGTLSGLSAVVGMEVLAQILQQDDLKWCDNKNTDKHENCPNIIASALRSALQSNLRLYGSNDVENWRWGDFHPTVYQHMPFSQVKTLKGLFERRIANGGSPDSINVASADFDRQEGYVQTFGAGFRQVIEMSTEKQLHLYMNSTGQSGNLVSQHYDDMIEPFRNVEFYQFDETTTKVSEIRLLPRQ